MCEYIILEDFKMDKYIYDENNGLVTCKFLSRRIDMEMVSLYN